MRPWNGIQRLTRPVSALLHGGPWIDTFYRARLDLWVVWAFIPPEPDAPPVHRDIILLGAFKERAKARLAADTALAYLRTDQAIMPMMLDLLGSNDLMGVLFGVSCAADSSPRPTSDHLSGRVLSRLCDSDLERLTQQIEDHPDTVQDWRFVWVGPPDGHPVPALMRRRQDVPVAAITLEADCFSGPEARFWLDGEELRQPCRSTEIHDNVLSPVVLGNLDQLMQRCDKTLHDRYGADSNAQDLLVLLQTEQRNEAVRQISVAFGTSSFVGEA